mgnify:CR=1 FL=1
MRETIQISSRYGDYDVIVGRNVLTRKTLHIDCLAKAKKVAIISQKNILELHGEKLLKSLSIPKERLFIRTVQRSEKAKSIETCTRLWQELLKEGFSRDSLIVAFGGGVVGDLAGFVASTLLRGIPWLNIPTTLLAQVDASVGGKTGINVPQGKNLVGAFYPPKRVIVHTAFLDTLSKKELKSGLGEVLKYAIGIDQRVWLKCKRESFKATPSAGLVTACLRAKADVVTKDELEGGLRKILNLGHTLAHAIEGAAPAKMSHGEAVAVGLRYALALAFKHGVASSEYVSEALDLLGKAQLAKRPPSGLTFTKLLPFFAVDKKSEKGGLTWVLPTGPGQCKLVKGLDNNQLAKVYTEF